MALIKDIFVQSNVYNDLPHINEVSNVPDTQAEELNILRGLLDKYNVPNGVGIRLIHKHFDVMNDEVMLLKDIIIPSHGVVRVMRPIKSPSPSKHHGTHYFVDSDGCLQAYEYGESEILGFSMYEAFLQEFCRVVIERGLQYKFGLKLSYGENQKSWTEFEFAQSRSTIMIPEGMPLPDAKYETNVVTEWYGDKYENNNNCSHTRTCTHCSHPSNHILGPQDLGLYLGGIRLEPGTAVHGLLTAVIKVW